MLIALFRLTERRERGTGLLIFTSSRAGQGKFPRIDLTNQEETLKSVY